MSTYKVRKINFTSASLSSKMQVPRFPCLPCELRPLPNVKTRGRDRALVPITAEDAQKSEPQGHKLQTPGLLYAPSVHGCDVLTWPHVWRAPANQTCSARKGPQYTFKAEVESSFQPDQFTTVHVQYMNPQSMSKEARRKQLNRVRRACAMLTTV